MRHVQIKWKAVFAAIIIVIVLAYVTYKLASSSIAVEHRCIPDPVLFKSFKTVDNYCNFPNTAAGGKEGKWHSPSTKLLSVHVVVRHGDRTPLHVIPGVVNRPFSCHDDDENGSAVNLAQFAQTMERRGLRKSGAAYGDYKTYPKEKTCDVGELTPAGARQHILNGRLLRSVYVDMHKLLKPASSKPLSEQILIRGTTIGRTFQSAVAFMYGFEPELDMSRFESIQVADNNTMCVEESGHKCLCIGVTPQYIDSFSSSYGQFSGAVGNLAATRRIAARLGSPISELPKLSHVFDVSMTHYCHRMTPPCFDTDLAADSLEAITEAGHIAVADPRYQRLARLKTQPLMYEIAQRLKLQAQSASVSIDKAPPNFVLYSGHDSTIEPLAAALGVSDGSWPVYASRLVVELYGEGSSQQASFESAHLRVLYDGRDMTKQLRFCKGRGVCHLKQFLDFVEDAEFNGGPGQTGYTSACLKGLDS